jgi:hypothetical protein
MRLASITLISALTAVAACGGGSDDPVDAAPRIDSRPPIDSDNPAACTFSPTYDTLRLGGDGMGGNPAPVDMMPGAGVGQTPTTQNYYLAIFGNLGGLEPELPNHGFELLLTDNIGAFAPGGEIGPFGGPPTVPDTTPTIDPLLPTGDPDAGFCGACVLGDGGMPTAMPPSQQNPPTQVYLADSGTMTITEFSAPPVDGQQSLVFGSFDNLVMTGLDATTGEPLNPPCTMTVTKLSFFYNVTWGVPPAAAPQAKAVKVVDVTR